jgi:hypothetical protein
MTKIGRNDPCQCGSGKKYKNCCGAKSSVGNRTLLIGGGVVLVALAIWFGRGILGGGGSGPPGPAPPGKVWSTEHGHWHDAQPVDGGQPAGTQPVTSGVSRPDTGNQPALPQGLAGTPQPPGEAPPGKVWSAEHGHWHDENPGDPGALQPPGEPPPGQIWSVEHGHWHNAQGVTPADSVPVSTP